MSAVPVASTEAERLCALHGYGMLDTRCDPAFDELAALAAQICGTPIGLISLLDSDREWLKARHGLTRTEMPRQGSFAAPALTQPEELLVVPDATGDVRFAGNPLVTGEPGIRFYAGLPLRTPAGHVIGTLGVMDRQPGTLSPDRQAALRILGRQVMAQLELHRSRNETSLSATRFRALSESAPLGIFECDAGGGCLYHNPALAFLSGRSLEKNLGQGWREAAHPDDQASVRADWERSAAAGRTWSNEHRVLRPDGSVRWVNVLTAPAKDAAGRVTGFVGTVEDITARRAAVIALRESEERFKFVARAVSDVVWDWNLATNTLWWNDGFLTTFGFAAGEIEFSVEAWTARIHPDDRRRVVESMQHAIAAGTENWSAEYRFQRKDGSYTLVQDRGYILRDASGKGVRMVGGMRDLTQQKKMEAQYLRAQRMESIGTLAGGIAHDLNNVLAPIMMSIELLKLDSGNDPARSKILDIIHGSSRRGSDLVRQVLSFARGMDGKRVAIKLRPLIDEIEAIISKTFPRNIRIATEVDANLWPVTGDPTQLHQVLLNLTVNARDAMPHGGTLTIAAANFTIDAQYAGTSPEAQCGPHVLLQVTDTGQGIPPEVRERIFEPFFTTKEIGKGTGLGLATVHAVVKSHGGFLSVESEVGRGTTFKVYLPADPALRTHATQHPFPADLPRGRGELVLVIDDEFSIRHITQQTLETFGYRVLTASDGAEAVALYARQMGEIAVVLTDMMMPIMDGPATIQVLMRLNPAIKIIAASGLESGYTVAKAVSEGVKNFLPKPYTAETMLKLIRDVLDGAAIPAGA